MTSTAIQLLIQQLIELFGTTPKRRQVIDRGAVDDNFMGELFGQTLQPFKLHRRPEKHLL
ncbi:MAG: hypothetical protein R3F53_25615 [Gammaproteobacteria bacterium]